MERQEVDAALAEIREALDARDWDRAAALIEALRPPDQAELFDDLNPEEQNRLIPELELEDSADILEKLEEERAAEVAGRLSTRQLTSILSEMEPDEAADLLGDLAPAQAARALAALEDSAEIRPFLAYPDESAGGLMTTAEIVLHKEMTVEEAISHLRMVKPDAETVYYLFVVDRENHLVGVVSLRQLIIAPPRTRISEIMNPDVIYVQGEDDQEVAARLMSRYDLVALPVVDAERHMLGVITHDDLVEVLEEEATEDIFRLGGVPEEHPVDVSFRTALRTRLPWLVLNLGTAMVSAVVLSLFESTIARVAVLAAFFPIVAGVSGSAGTQTLTVTVRGLALGELDPQEGVRTLGRELLIGLADGLAVGSLVATIALVWRGSPMLGVVVGVATLLNLIAAAAAGALVPVGLQALNIDPALASPILVTTITDAFGYFAYLGLASLAIGMLI
jgi:magnesium transporter